MMPVARRSTLPRASGSTADARNSGRVMAPVRCASFLRRGATNNQLMRNPPSVAGNSHRAGSPQ